MTGKNTKSNTTEQTKSITLLKPFLYKIKSIEVNNNEYELPIMTNSIQAISDKTIFERI